MMRKNQNGKKAHVMSCEPLLIIIDEQMTSTSLLDVFSAFLSRISELIYLYSFNEGFSQLDMYSFLLI